MNRGEYLESLIEKNHSYIEKIKADSKERKKSREPEIQAAYERGLKQGAVNDGERIKRDSEEAALREVGLVVPCYLCQKWIVIPKGDHLHLEILNWLYPRQLCHHHCAELERIQNKKYPDERQRPTSIFFP